MKKKDEWQLADDTFEADELRYWIAINGASCAICAMRMAPFTFTVSPVPELLLGFRTLKEASEWQHYLLTAPMAHVEERMATCPGRIKSSEIVYVRPAKPEPPQPITFWTKGNPLSEFMD